MNLTVLLGALSATQGHLFAGASTQSVQLINAYALIYAALLVPVVSWTPRRAQRQVLLMGLLLCLVGTLGCALAPSPGMLVAARVSQAVGAAMMTPSSLALALSDGPRAGQGAVVGLWIAAAGVAALLGWALGRCITEHVSWRWAFVLQCPFGVWLWTWALRSSAGLHRDDTGASIDRPEIALLVGGALGTMSALFATLWVPGLSHVG